MLVPVYDILNCGPRKRFVANGKLVHNSDKLNLQNLPSRGNTTLKSCIIAPDGYDVIDCDSSQIEARVLAWLAGQDDLVEQFAQGRDVYKYMASKIYNKPVEEITSEERFMGKTVVLGCGYGMGHVKFHDTLRLSGVKITLEECRDIIEIYRESNPAIVALWKNAQRTLEAMITGQAIPIGVQSQAIYMDEEDDKIGFRLPSGYLLSYPDLQKNSDGEFSYKTRNGRTKIYGGKVVENVVQALARCVVGEQIVKISEQYRPILTVHDAVAIIAHEDDDEAVPYVEKCMKKPPKWATGLPVNCESGRGKSYGDC